MKPEKLESYSQTAYPERVTYLCDILTESLDEITLDYIKELSEICYKEGYKDGMRFVDWLNQGA